MRRDLRVQGMTCGACAEHVDGALKQLDGVRDAHVDYLTGRAVVDLAHDVPARALTDAVVRAGYRAEVAEQHDGSARAGAVTPEASMGSETDSRPSMDGRIQAVPVQDVPWRAASAVPLRGPDGSDFDLLVIGSGGAGVAAAIQAAGMGARVAVAEHGTLGGTCVNVGCIPSKNLIEAAAHYHRARTGFSGIAPCEPALDWRAVLTQKDALVDGLRQAKYADVLASYDGITRLGGHARLLGDGRVRVDDVEYGAPKIIVATGTTPARPPIPGLDDVDALDSTSAMTLETLPKSLIVLGGSAVGLELGQTFARFGTKVTIVELLPRLLPNEDEAISEALEGYLAAEGIEIHTGVTTTRVERDGGDVVVHMRQGSLAGQVRAERILVAAGRRPNTRDLGLEEAGVELTASGFVKVDATLRTSNPDVYAAGDVTGGPGYVYVAAAGGRVAAENALSGAKRELDLNVVPNVTFTDPQVGSVGLTEARARAAGYDVEVATLPMEHVPRALVSRDTRGLVKVVAEVGSGKLLGVHAVAPHAGEMMGEATLAVRFGLTARDLTGTLHPYLTWGESLKLAAQGFASDVTKLSCCA